MRRSTVALMLLASLVGCRGWTSSHPPIHPNPNMDRQPKYLPQAESTFFADGATMRPPVPGTVARGELFEDEALFLGHEGDQYVERSPLPGGQELTARGADRYAIYCGPCHGARGDGKGMLFRRAEISSADLREARIAAMPDGQLFETITHGVGLMPGYGDYLPARDRWAIVAHVRTLQGGEDAR